MDLKKGRAALKCPSVSGGKWFSDLNSFDECPQMIDVVKGKQLNILYV